MSFEAIEKGSFGGMPQEGFLFTHLGLTYAYTSGREFVTIDGQLYTPTYINRGKIKNEEDMFKTSLDITVASDNPLPLLFRTWIEGAILFTLTKTHYEDGEFLTIWNGRIVSCDFKGPDATLHAETIYTNMRKKGLRRCFQRSCPYNIYNPISCKVNPDLYKTSTTVQIIDGSLITLNSSGHDDDYFKAGYFQRGNDRRLILSSTSDTVTLQAPISGMEVNDVCDLWAGCDKLYASCLYKFDDNTDNYGGFTHIPHKNPFQVTLYG